MLVFKLCRPEAQSVAVVSTDIPGAAAGGIHPMTRDETGMWHFAAAQPLPAGEYGYNFSIDGTETFDPNGREWAQKWTGISAIATVEAGGQSASHWSADVPHGAISEIRYWSPALGIRRKAVVYTPPGYMNGDASYPVLYLVHGAGGSSTSWTDLGAANVIMDNLIAGGAALPMIVVMPDGHAPIRALGTMADTEDFGADLHDVLIPYIDSNFRTVADAPRRAMAGLSMGGRHTIYNGLTRSDHFRFIGIFSMGMGYESDAQGLRPDNGRLNDYLARYDAGLRRSAQELELVWFGMGTEDFLHFTAAPLNQMMDEYGIEHTYFESGGGHTWINWRDYLERFAPLLFRDRETGGQ